MKVKINKLLPFNQENKKLKLGTVAIDQKNYYILPYNVDQKNYVGCLILLQFICNVPDINSDYEYLRCEVRVEIIEVKMENIENKTITQKKAYSFQNIKRNEGKRQFVFEFIPPFRGSYNIILDLAYKQKYFIQSTQAPQQKKDSLKANLTCQDPFHVEENVIYEEKPSSISFPLFIQYIVSNKLKQTLNLQMSFTSQFFDHKFLNNHKLISILGGEAYFIMLQVQQKPDKKRDTLFGQKGLMIGTLWLTQGKSKFEKKIFLKQGFKHLLFRGETIDKKVVKKDIVEVRIKFINIYQIDYNTGPIRIGIDESKIPTGIKLLKISKDKIDLTKNSEEVVVLTLICLRSGLFQLRGIQLNARGNSSNVNDQRILKYINQLNLIVENEKQQKKDSIMQKTTEIQIELI